jgi:murein DD-endopeptidase MepM/ murein hydrolase activator NlpD
MVRRSVLVLTLGVCLVLAAPAAGDNSGKIQQLHAKIAAAQQREAALNSQIASVTTEIRSLERRVGGVSMRLSLLKQDLALHQRRLDKLNALFELETQRLVALQGEYTRVLNMLNRRLVDIYESRSPSTFEVLLNSKSLQDAVEQLHYLSAIALQDKKITHDVGAARDAMRVVRARTSKIRVVVQAETKTVAVRTQEQQLLHDQLLASRNNLASARSRKQHALTSTKQQEQDWLAEAATLEAQDARIRGQLAAAQGSSDTTPSSHGLIWPVNGPVTSPFGMRWGKLHPGIDIGVPTGTPIHAAASGTVVIAGWVSGYGNYTCIDHGGGLATCYGHQETIYVSVGQHVTQGQVIGLTDCTGYCFGPHLHFEVRINGTPVDPMGYL